MQNKNIQLIISVLSVISLPIIIYLAFWHLIFYDIHLYSQFLTKNNSLNLTIQWLNYFQGKEKPESIYGFTDLEKQHMQDVKNLVDNLELFFFGLIIIFLALLFFAENKSAIFFYGGIITMILPIILYFLPFNFTFDLFHRIFFEGNWQFSSDSLLIQTFPEDFFYNFAFRIFSLSFVFGLIIALSAWKHKHSSKHL